MGAATDASPISLSLTLVAYPRRRSTARSSRRRSGSVIVYGVFGSGRAPASTSSSRSGGRWVSSVLPVLVQWAGMRSPMRPNSRRVFGLSRRST